MWGQIAAVCEDMLREQIADVLNANKPAWIAGLNLDRCGLKFCMYNTTHEGMLVMLPLAEYMHPHVCRLRVVQAGP